MQLLAACTHPLLALVAGARCAGCGSTREPTPCGRCLAQLRCAPAAEAAAFRDGGVVGRLVRRAKAGDWRAGARVLGALMLERAGGTLLDARIDVVTWIPAEPRRRAMRGGHLPEGLARTVARGIGSPSTELLRRRRGSPPQRGLRRGERLHNAAGAYAVAGDHARRVLAARPRVLLLDDVRTTGATMHAASRVLAAHGAVVHALALVGVDGPRTGTCACGSAEHPHVAQKTRSGIEPKMPMMVRTPFERQRPD